mgnify:CR=1 FL=1
MPAEELLPATRAWATRLAQGPTKAYGLIKRQLDRALYDDLETMLDYEVYNQETAGGTADYTEALAAFVEKRSAAFKGE